MDVPPTAAAATAGGDVVKDELAEKCQKLFQAFLEEYVFKNPFYCLQTWPELTSTITTITHPF